MDQPNPESTPDPASSATEAPQSDDGAMPSIDAVGLVRTCSIVIPVHNKASLTRQCLTTLLAQTDDAIARQIVVVDDGSRDLTPDLLASYGGRIHAVRYDQPGGFAAACNAGAAVSSGDYLIFLNNDTLPRAGWLSALAAYADRHPEAAVVGTKLLYPNDTVQHAGVVFGQDRFPHHLYAGFPADHPAVNKSRRFQVVTAACCLIRREAFAQAGGFDTGYRNGWEDVDLCLRLADLGQEVHYCADSVVYHLESASRDPRAPQERENRDRFEERWRDRVRPDALDVYAADGLLNLDFTGRYPLRLSVSPLLAGVTIGDDERAADRLLQERARHVAILLRNNIILNLRVQEAELKTQAAEIRARRADRRADALAPAASPPPPRLNPSASTPVPRANPPQPSPSATPQSNSLIEPSETPPTHQPIIGSVERPGREPQVVGPGYLPVSGWALSKSGIIDVQTLVDGELRGKIEYGSRFRPDVAALHADIPGAGHSGFFGLLPIDGLQPGKHDLVIRLNAFDNHRVDVATSFIYDPSATSRGTIVGAIDQPALAARAVARDRLHVAGWALASSGVRAIESFVDGVPLGQVTHGALRPDVGAAHADYPAPDHGGFTGSIPVADLADGEHQLVVRVTSKDDQRHDLTTSFAVDTSGSAIGEVPHVNRTYPAWLRAHASTADAIARVRAELASLDNTPRLGLIVTVGNLPASILTAFVDRLQAQPVDNWRLRLALDSSASQELLAAVDRFSLHDARVARSLFPDNAGSIGLLRIALDNTDADVIAVVDPQTVLAPLALADTVRYLHLHPACDVIYGDEDKIDPLTGVRWDPFFKPDWSPALLLSADHFGPLTWYRRSLLDRIDAGPPSTAAAYDLALRATEQTDRIGHVPHVLASRPAALAVGPTPPPNDVVAAERAALEDALDRRDLAATVEPGIRPGRWRVRFALDDQPEITVVLPTGGKLDYLRPCLDDLLHRTTYPNLQILIVDNSTATDVAALRDAIGRDHPRLRRVPFDEKPFNFAAIANFGVAQVETPHLILLNDDVTVVNPDWVEAMLEQAQQPDVGIVGAKLLYPDDTFQHAGVTLGPYDGTGHAFKTFPADHIGAFGLPNVVRDYSAVTFACAMMRKSLFDQVGGLDTTRYPIAFNDVDLCLRVRELGHRVVYTPHAILYHHESVTKTVIADPTEIEHLRARWGHIIERDPYYNPNLTRTAEDFSLDMTGVESEE